MVKQLLLGVTQVLSLPQIFNHFVGYAEDPKHENFKQLLIAPKQDAMTILKNRFPMPRYVESDQHKSQARFLLAAIDPVVTHTNSGSNR